ncbi:MAG: geranylgeranylglycerol-phosphate geranylgeranyltransferase [Bacteroidota bacterium]|nr:geranylgeranylglycerol-phosphate geranylgeranyltransferase [Bacteroidota bacterium]
MKNFLKLIRIPNLLIIILTQGMLRYFIILPLLGYQSVEPAMELMDFGLLVLATLLIAAAGYIINDYFDVDADRVNKPERVIVGKKIRFENAKLLYYAINVVAIVIGFYFAFSYDAFQLALIFPIIIIMLYYYSARYKNMPFWGNMVVGILSGFTVFIVWLFEFFALRSEAASFIEAQDAFGMINIMVWGYTAFAFLTSMVREMIKDVQDIEGDKRVGSATMPVRIGVNASRYIIMALVTLTIISLGIAQYFLFDRGFGFAAWYLVITVQFMLAYLVVRLATARQPADYKFLSGLSKIIMVAGILSMQLIDLDL